MKTVKIYFVSGGVFTISKTAADVQNLITNPYVVHASNPELQSSVIHLAPTATTPDTYLDFRLVERIEVV